MFMRRQAPRLLAGVSLTLATAACALVFGAVWALVLRPLPYRQPDRLVEIWNASPGFHEMPLGYEEYRALENEKENVFASVSALGGGGTSPNMFRTLGVSPILGRDFDASDAGGPACIANHYLWKSELHGDPNRLGTFITWDSQKCQLIGVMPPGFRLGFGLGGFYGPQSKQVWRASDFPRESANPGMLDLYVVARLAPGVSRSQASAALRVISASLARKPGDGLRMYLLPLDGEVTRKPAVDLVPLLVSVLALLALAAVNLACFTSLRVRSRLRSLAIRAALGAGRKDLLVAALREPLLDVAISVGAGLLLAWWGLHAFPSRVALPLPRWYSVAMDWRVAAFVGVCGLAVLGFTAVPALLLLRRRDLSSALKPGGVQVPSPLARGVGRRPLTAAVVFQFAGTLALLSGIGAMFLTLRVLLRPANVGFDPNGLISVNLSIRPTVASEAGAAAAAKTLSEALPRIEAAARSLPGVRSVAVAGSAPLTGFSLTGNVRYSAAGKVGTTGGVRLQPVSIGYFRTLGVPLIRGRPFESTDRAGSAPVAIVNKTFMSRFLAGADPLSARVREYGRSTWAKVVGVAGDVRQSVPESAPKPEVYYVASQAPLSGEFAILARTSLPAETMLPELRAVVEKAAPAANINSAQSMQAELRKATATRRFTLWSLGAFGLIALLVAATGLYSIVAFFANQSLRAYAVRMALGSTPGGVLALVMKRAGLIAGTGIAVGVLGAWTIGHVLHSLLYGVAPTDPAILVVAAGVLGLVSFLAAYPTARAAARIDSARLLREE